MITWFLGNIVGVLGIVVGGFIAYHVYFLSEKIDLRDKLVHRNTLRKQVEFLLHRIGSGSQSDVEMVNSKKYEKHYPHNNEMNRDGYTYLRAELKSLRFDGVEFFCDMAREIYQHTAGTFRFEKDSDDQKESMIVYPVGLLPYEWIVHIALSG